jgi:Holliday junction DNA helicase RuvA
MIGRLHGTLLSDDTTPMLLVDVGGVGYEVHAPAGTAARAQDGGANEVTLHIHTHVREDSFDLFGFASEPERRAFRLLIGVPNVGPKTALAVLSALPIPELAAAVQAGDVGRLSKVPQIGKKTAERLILELKEKLLDVEAAPVGKARSAAGNAERLLLALTSMGYGRAEAERAVSALGERVNTDPLDQLLRDALAVFWK